MSENKYKNGKETSHKLFLETGDLGYYYISKGFENLEKQNESERMQESQPEM